MLSLYNPNPALRRKEELPNKKRNEQGDHKTCTNNYTEDLLAGTGTMVQREAMSALQIVAATCLGQYPAPVIFAPVWCDKVMTWLLNAIQNKYFINAMKALA